MLIGADGVWSEARRAMQVLDTTFEVKRKEIDLWYKTYMIEPAKLPWSLLKLLQENAEKRGLQEGNKEHTGRMNEA